ncbi:hypothetical protein XENOCAPTIV_001789 [Xenoophorus captivus]|uniref:Rab-GAP TBC domain-containing protein n=1 Tax=Xenoophorus captivus TaxID=1517983 RepID=A0ABV0RN79_9TELE
MLRQRSDVCVCSCPRRILLNYAVFNPDMGYCQGMSDLVAPLLTEIQDESDTFWCFVGLMENTIFISSPRDEDMERQLTDYFHLFLCVAIIVLYGEDVTEQQLATDQMLLHFMQVSAMFAFFKHAIVSLLDFCFTLISPAPLFQARSLLYQFRLLPRIPCSLHDLCKLCGPGMWDSRYIPTVECSGEHPDSQSCPYGGTSTPQPSSPSPSSSPNHTPTPPLDGKRGCKKRDIFTFRKQS